MKSAPLPRSRRKSSSFFSQHFSRTLTKTITTNPEPSTSTTRCPNFAQGEEDDLAKALLTILRVSRFCSVEGGLESGFVLPRKRSRKDFAAQALQFFQYPIPVRGGPSR